jgi:hypothetical protein
MLHVVVSEEDKREKASQEPTYSLGWYILNVEA